jgi:hypothetical protein
MGTSIHFFVEFRFPNSPWYLQDILIRRNGKLQRPEGEWPLYWQRNYRLFAIFADVRNYPPNALVPMGVPRGIPHDASDDYREIASNEFAKSHSFFTLREILEYDWTRTGRNVSRLDFPSYAKWVAQDRANKTSLWKYENSTFAQTGEKDNPHELSPSAMQELNNLRNSIEDEDQNKLFLINNSMKFTYIESEIPYYIMAKEFFIETIPKLLAISNGPDGIDNLRCLFFFQS